MTKKEANELPDFLERARSSKSKADRAAMLEEIFEAFPSSDDEQASRYRQAFVILLKKQPSILENDEATNFLARQVKPADFDVLQWQSPEHMVEFCEVLYGFRFSTEKITRQVRLHVQAVLREALLRYERDKNWEKLFLLLRIAPTSPVMQDVSLQRFRHIAHAYEVRRTQRNSRILFGYLVLQALLIIVVFPFLFIFAENGEIQRRVEQIAGVEIGDSGHRLFSYVDGLYWTVITAASIGYGDITPRTTTGRMLASIIGTMGVITIGVIAGLVLKWITPRQLD